MQVNLANYNSHCHFVVFYQVSSEFIGKRLKALRESKSITQDAVAEMLGINDRQTISAIETGQRRMSVDELTIAAEKFNVSLDFFTDPFRLEGEGVFAWRANRLKPTELQEWESRAGIWIALFRTLANRLNIHRPVLRHSLNLSRKSSVEDASAIGERFWSNYEPCEYPAKRLKEFMEKELNYLVLLVDMGPNISGAACRVSDLDIVLIARHDVNRRRNFTLAHELFHMLTWDRIPPEHMEDLSQRKNHVELLAENFAAALLMPSNVLRRYGSWTDLPTAQVINKLNSVATELGVTSQALKWRLVNVGALSSRIARSISNSSLRNNGVRNNNEEIPAAFSRDFMEVIGHALDEGFISVRRTVNALDITIEDLQELFESHGVACEIDL